MFSEANVTLIIKPNEEALKKIIGFWVWTFFVQQFIICPISNSEISVSFLSLLNSILFIFFLGNYPFHLYFQTYLCQTVYCRLLRFLNVLLLFFLHLCFLSFHISTPFLIMLASRIYRCHWGLPFIRLLLNRGLLIPFLVISQCLQHRSFILCPDFLVLSKRVEFIRHHFTENRIFTIKKKKASQKVCVIISAVENSNNV